ncbi:MAG: D-alanine--poly(phosphoribitol) ligase subunit DltA [Chloroflexi bacterium]|nr:D-alanine--poly(phosphoribitol) ligase subunit DltA [Chloroflexota bacterium]
MNILERIDSLGRRVPEKVAHVSGPSTLTYGTLLYRSNALAAQIAGMLPDDGSPVVVLGHKECEMLVAFLSVIKSGHPYAPVDAFLPPQRVARIRDTSGSQLTLTPEYVSRLPDIQAAPPRRQAKPSDPYYIMFTSGSTGDPKGVVITFGCLEDFLVWMLAEQRMAEGQEVFLNQAPFSFDLSIMDLYLSLLTGGTLFSVTSQDIANPRQLYQKLAAAQLTIWVSTPSFARLCLAERRFNAEMLPRLRLFLFCGETLPPEVAAVLLDRFPAAEVWNTYGPTEATVAMTSVRIDRQMIEHYPSLPIGFPKPRTLALVMDEAGWPVAPGERGEIVIAGPNVSPGYLGRPDLTARSFFKLDGQQAYRTGDWGRYRDGLLFFEGRKDSQIKLHGYRIEIGDIEANLRALPGVRDATVVPEGKDGSYDSLTAYLIMADRPSGSDFEVSCTIREQLAERLPAYMLPRKFCFRQSFPMTTNGKVDRRSLVDST